MFIPTTRISRSKYCTSFDFITCCFNKFIRNRIIFLTVRLDEVYTYKCVFCMSLAFVISIYNLWMYLFTMRIYPLRKKKFQFNIARTRNPLPVDFTFRFFCDSTKITSKITSKMTSNYCNCKIFNSWNELISISNPTCHRTGLMF